MSNIKLGADDCQCIKGSKLKRDCSKPAAECSCLKPVASVFNKRKIRSYIVAYLINYYKTGRRHANTHIETPYLCVDILSSHHEQTLLWSVNVCNV